MNRTNDYYDVITGMAALGEVYLRITGTIRSMYEKNPLFHYEAGRLIEKLGYGASPFGLEDLVDTVLKEKTLTPLKEEERLLLCRYAKMFADPILAREAAEDMAGSDGKKREKVIDSLKARLGVFPDPGLGFSDLIDFGYMEGDIFPVGKEMALKYLDVGEITVFLLFADGRKETAADEEAVLNHNGMTGILRSEWVEYCLAVSGHEETVPSPLGEGKKKYGIYQWKKDLPERREVSFTPYDVLCSMEISVTESKYDLMYEGYIAESVTLEDIFEMFNINRPDDFTGHSLSVGDVVTFGEGDEREAFFVDSIGFVKLKEFFGREMLPPFMKEEAELPESKTKDSEGKLPEKAKIKPIKR